MSKLNRVWVISDDPKKLPELAQGAAQFGEQVAAIVIGGDAVMAQAQQAPLACIYQINDDSMVFEDYAASIAAVIGNDQATALFLANSRRCKALAAKLAFRLGATLANDTQQLQQDGAAMVSQHLMYGGLAVSKQSSTAKVAIFTIASGTFDSEVAAASTEADIVAVEVVAPAQTIRCVERRQKQLSGVDLSKARRVIGIGSGIGSKENLEKAQVLAGRLGAELGCSRPIAETDKWMDRERYIGVSGVMLKPDFYMAVGISGQIQHMVGVNAAKTIVAINKDKNAPIFQYADIGIIGDSQKVVAKLMESFA